MRKELHMENRMRVKFYSENDLGSAFQLGKIPNILDGDLSLLDYSDVNQIIELENIRKYIDSGLALNDWTDSQIEKYTMICKGIIPKQVAIFFKQITNDNIITLHDSIDKLYYGDFWELFEKYNLQSAISVDLFSTMISADNVQFLCILEHQKIVKTYGSVISDYLRNHPELATLILRKHLQRRDDQKEMFLPVELTPEDKAKLVAKYIDLPDANPNYVELIIKSNKSQELPIDDHIKLKANHVYRQWVNDHINFETGIRLSASVRFEDTDVAVDYTIIDSNIEFIYGTKWIKNNMDCPTLLNNFIYLFWLVDEKLRCILVSLPNHMNVVERYIGIKSRFEYSIGNEFRLMELVSSAQVSGYMKFLAAQHIQIESLFKWFFECYLKLEFGVDGFIYDAPSKGTRTVEKCRTLAIAMDSILKQFRLFCQDGIIDRELFEMSSEHLLFDRIPSMLTSKYVYAKSETIKMEMYLCYSDQVMLTYNRKTKGTYDDLPDMLRNEEMMMEDFKHYQIPQIEFLVQRGLIIKDDRGHFTINEYRAKILEELYNHEVLCYSYCTPEKKTIVDRLVISDDLEMGSTLFSKPEQDYLNYMLNNAEYSNGLKIRNKYIHGTNSLKEAEIEHDYVELLKITAVMVIKINEEFCLRHPINDSIL